MRRNKMLIHFETGNIFFENKNSGESICDFFYAQCNHNQKLLTINLSFGVDYESYISDYLMSIKTSDDDKYDMMTTKN